MRFIPQIRNSNITQDRIIVVYATVSAYAGILSCGSLPDSHNRYDFSASLFVASQTCFFFEQYSLPAMHAFRHLDEEMNIVDPMCRSRFRSRNLEVILWLCYCDNPGNLGKMSPWWHISEDHAGVSICSLSFPSSTASAIHGIKLGLSVASLFFKPTIHFSLEIPSRYHRSISLQLLEQSLELSSTETTYILSCYPSFL